MQDISGGFDHFSIVVVAAAHTDRHLETDGPAIELKCDANLQIRPIARSRLDAGHLDLDFPHLFIRAGGGPLLAVEHCDLAENIAEDLVPLPR